MRPSRCLVSAALLIAILLCLVVLGAAVLWSSPPGGYRGTIYFADRYGVWKMWFPQLEPVRLVSQDLFDPWSLTLSPDQGWLTYWTEYPDNPGNAQWVVSTQGGAPQQVNRLLGQGGKWFGQHQLVYMDPGGAFVFDPETGHREKADRWEPAIGSCCRMIDPSGREAVLQAPGASKDSRGYLRLVELNGRPPITITEPYHIGLDVEWSRDGEQVLFSDWSDSAAKLFVWRRSDGMMRQVVGQVSQEKHSFLDLTWSPDGRWAAFADVGRVPWCLVEIATGRVQCFDNRISSYGTKITWSPDSRAILVWRDLIGALGWRSGDLLAQGHRVYVVGVPDGAVLDITPREHVPQAMAWRD